MIFKTFADEMVWNRHKCIYGNYRVDSMVAFLSRAGMIRVDSRSSTYTARKEFKINLQVFRPGITFGTTTMTYACTDPKLPVWGKEDEMAFILSSKITQPYKNTHDVIDFLESKAFVVPIFRREKFVVKKDFMVGDVKLCGEEGNIGLDDMESKDLLHELIRTGAKP